MHAAKFLLLIFVITIVHYQIIIAQTTLIPEGADWKYLDDGSDQGTAWRDVNFNDDNWKIGAAQLGYGDGDEATVVEYGPDANNKYPTTYFRNNFFVSNPSQYIVWDMQLVRDDGAIVYLNGNEIHRVNMQAGEVTFSTFANADGTDATFFPLEIQSGFLQYLQEGKNTIAVEIHQSSGNSSDLSFDFKFIAWNTTPPAPPLVRKEPYLIYEGINTEMALHWQLNESKACSVFYGEDESYSTGNFEVVEYGTSHQHKFTFKDLKQNTRYFYKVSVDTFSYQNNFFTAPDSLANNLKFVAYGDSRSFPLVHDLLASKILNHLAEGYQTISIGVGDYCDNGGAEESWDTEYFSPELTNVRKLMGSIAIMGTIGDHEDDGDGGVLYRKYLQYPFNNQFGKYFSFNYGPALFISIDQYSSLAKTGTQYKWLENILMNSTKKWKFVFFHEPGWSTGSNGNNVTVQNLLQPLFEKYKVAVTLGGHNHLYARGTVNGIKHITTGGGGAPLYNPSPDDLAPNIEIYSKTYHYCLINIEGDQLTFTVHNIEGNIIDQFTINSLVSVESEKEKAYPTEYKLFDAYPNPFNPSTTISFSLPQRSRTKLEIYDSLGKLVTTVINADLLQGTYHYNWNAQGLASGIYIIKLTADNHTFSKKLNLIK